MTRQNETLCLVLLALMLCAPVQAQEAEVSEQETIGGLTCFSISPPAPKNFDPYKAKSCKALCADHGAACSGVTNGALNPPTKCEDPAPPQMAVCRCCKVQS